MAKVGLKMPSTGSGGSAGYISAILGEYKIDANSYTAPPATGYIRYNNATQTSATEIYIHDISTTGVDASIFFDLLRTGARFVIQDKDDHANNQIFEISSTPTNNTNYWTIPVTLLSSTGTGTTGFANNHHVFAAAFNPDIDEKVKISSNDTTAGYLNGKLVGSTTIGLTENNDGGNETLTVAINSGSIDESHLDASVNASLDLADSALQAESDPVFGAWLAGPPNISEFTNDAGYAKLDSTNQPFTSLGQDSLSTANRLAYDTSEVISIDWESRNLRDSNGVVVDWSNYFINDTYASLSIDWDERILVDSSTSNSLKWNSRELIKSDGSTVSFDWQNLKFPTLTTNGVLTTTSGDGTIAVNTTGYIQNSPANVTDATYNTTSLLGQWDINGDTSTTAIDDSGNGRNGTYQGGLGQTDNANGIIGKYITLDGVNDYITVPHNAVFNTLPLSICFSFRTTATPLSYTAFVEKYNTGSLNGYLVYLDTSARLNAWYYVASGRGILEGALLSTKAYNDGAWHRVVAILNTSGGELWVDGVQVDTGTWSGATGNCTTTETLKIGAHPSFSRYFAGSMDEILVYNKTMTSGEILIDYNTAMNAHYVEGRGDLSLGHTSGWGSTRLRGTDILAPDATTIVLGSNTDNRGNSIIVGSSNTASIGNGAEKAVVYGVSNTLSGHRSLAVGVSNTAGSSNAIAVGYGNNASGASSVALGNNCSAAANQIAIGISASASGSGFLSIGTSTSSTGSGAIAIGSTVTASGSNSINIGTANSNCNHNSFLIGTNITTTSGNTAKVAYGQSINMAGGTGTVVIGLSNTTSRTSSTSAGLAFGYGNNVAGDSSAAFGRSLVSNLPQMAQFGIGSHYYAVENTNSRYSIHQHPTMNGLAINRDVIILDSASVGSELGLNTDFSTGPFTNWDVTGSGWTWSAGNSRAEHSGATIGYLKQTQFLTQGAVYELQINTWTFSDGATFYFTCAGYTLPTITLNSNSSTANMVFRFVAANGGGLSFSGNGLEIAATGTFTIDNISLKQVTGGKAHVLKEFYVGLDTDSQDHQIATTGVIFNNQSADIDFTVKTDGGYSGLFVDASNDATHVMNNASGKISFFAATPATKQTLNAYTSDGEGSAYTGIDNAQVGTVYAQLTDLNQLRVAYETLRASYDDLRTKLLNTTLVG